MADLKITNLHKHYGGVQAVRGIDLEVASGEFTVVPIMRTCPTCSARDMLRSVSVTQSPVGDAGAVVDSTSGKDGGGGSLGNAVTVGGFD